MATYQVKGLKDLNRLLKKHGKERAKRVEKGLLKAAKRGVKVAQANVPVAFAELKDSIQGDPLPGSVPGARTVAYAPYAEAVERGSRPHWMPLAPLIKWVKLRGMQGLKSPKQIDKLKGPTTALHARSVAQQIHGMASGGATPVSAPEQIARAIQAAIAKHGTKPSWFMQKSVPGVLALMDEEIKAALPDKEQ